MSIAQPLQLLPKDQPRDRPLGIPSIHSSFDEAGLTLEAHRVFDHLARRASPIITTNGEIRWAAWPSLNSIAEKCFRGSYPNSSIEVLRRKAFASIQELSDRHMVEVEHRKHSDGGTASNLYYLLPLEHWKPASSKGNLNVRKGRSRKPSDPGKIFPSTSICPPHPLILPGSEGDPMTITGRSSQDQKGYPIEVIPMEVIPIEREKAAQNFPPPPNQEQPSITTPADAAQPQIQPDSVLQGSIEDTSSAAPPEPEKTQSSSFDPKIYTWAEYQHPGDGGSNPLFWDYMVCRTQDYSDRRVKAKKKRVDDIQAYALAQIQNDGATFYHDFEVVMGLRVPDEVQPASSKAAAPVLPTELHWSESGDWEEEVHDLSDAIARVKIHWQLLKLGWQDPRWLMWLDKTQQMRPFKFDVKYGGLRDLPSWVVQKLDHDLQRSSGGRL